jgi:signal transduction histidine kinase
MASGVAHDVNNLLTVVLGHAGLLQPVLPAGSSARGLLTGIEKAAQSASDLANQVLALARQQETSSQAVDLNGLVHELMGLLRRVSDPRIGFEVTTADNLPAIRGVPSQLTQILLNLCLNARDAMPSGGKLRVQTALMTLAEGERVRLRVADTGSGIAPELLPHIFESFVTSRPGQGTGLGLATVQRLARQHQGRVECQSEVGKGSCFDVYLPTLDPQH